MAGGIIIRLQAAVDAVFSDENLSAQQKARLLRQLAFQFIDRAHTWLGRKVIECKAVFGMHG